MKEFVERKPYYSREGGQGIRSTFNVKVPEIYQVEVTNACNFDCKFCPRTPEQTGRPTKLLQVGLARLISERDLAGSYFVEFQMSGEPLLHPRLDQIISFFEGKVLTGLSTNGYLINANLHALSRLDYITISVDSVDDYESIRPGGKFSTLLENIGLLVRFRQSKTLIDLQLIEFDGVEDQVNKLKDIVKEHGWEGELGIRTVPDCFLGMTRDHVKVEHQPGNICLNPWTSVSVQSDGRVTSCCFSFGKDVQYGDLNIMSLEEVWANSSEVKAMRTEHLTGNYRPICDACYMRSPVLLHWDFYTDIVKRRMLQE